MKLLRSRVEFPPQRSVPWTLKDVGTAKADFHILDDGAFAFASGMTFSMGGQYE